MKRFFLLGPTASGKTEVALILARKLGAEIVSLDSMLVYRGMDIGTAKPTAEERAAVPHHLIDVVDPSEEYSVARYLQATREVEADLAGRGRAALYVGGTTMWFKALVFGLLQTPEIPAELQRELEQELEERGGEEMHRRLAEVDPAAAERIHPNDDRRLLRALGVWRVSGRALSDWQEQWGAGRSLQEPAALLDWPREVLRDRVVRRFEGMLTEGLLDEIQAIQAGCGFGRTAGKAIGYRQFLDHLAGQCSLEQAVQKAVTRTHVLIRRQMTWLRSFPEILRLERSAEEPAAAVAEKLAALWASQGNPDSFGATAPRPE